MLIFTQNPKDLYILNLSEEDWMEILGELEQVNNHPFYNFGNTLKRTLYMINYVGGKAVPDSSKQWIEQFRNHIYDAKTKKDYAEEYRLILEAIKMGAERFSEAGWLPASKLVLLIGIYKYIQIPPAGTVQESYRPSIYMGGGFYS